MINTTFDEFRAGLWVMLMLDDTDLRNGGISLDEWRSFHRDRFRWFLHASDDDAAKLWSIIEARQPGRGES